MNQTKRDHNACSEYINGNKYILEWIMKLEHRYDSG